jgi:hypothetical protein
MTEESQNGMIIIFLAILLKNRDRQSDKRVYEIGEAN